MIMKHQVPRSVTNRTDLHRRRKETHGRHNADQLTIVIHSEPALHHPTRRLRFWLTRLRALHGTYLA